MFTGFNQISTVVTQELRKNNWHMTDFINCIKEEVNACENCDLFQNKNDYQQLRS